MTQSTVCLDDGVIRVLEPDWDGNPWFDLEIFLPDENGYVAVRIGEEVSSLITAADARRLAELILEHVRA